MQEQLEPFDIEIERLSVVMIVDSTFIGFPTKSLAERFVGLCKKNNSGKTPEDRHATDLPKNGFWRPLDAFEMRGLGADLAGCGGEIWVV